MKPIFDPEAPRTVCTLSINEDLLRQARELGIDLGQTLEASLTDEVREAKTKVWIDENKDAMAAMHHWVEENGLLSDHFRMF